MKWLIKVSLEHPSLIIHEINSILGNAKIKWLYESIAIIECTQDEMDFLCKSSSILKFVIKNPVIEDYDTLIDFEQSIIAPLSLGNLIVTSNEFVVRHHHLGVFPHSVSSESIEKKIGGQILVIRNDWKVNLTQLDNRFFIFSWGNKSGFGWLYREIDYSPIKYRAPKYGPYFRGGGMKPRLCRLMVNLLHPLDPVILDSFAGHCGILREVSDQGSFCLGIEISYKIAREALVNNKHFQLDDNLQLILGDALNPPLRKQSIRYAITDPPYAIQTTTKGINPNELIYRWLNTLESKTTVVFASPVQMSVKLQDDWQVLIEEDDYVHKSLTRKIIRMQKVT